MNRTQNRGSSRQERTQETAVAVVRVKERVAKITAKLDEQRDDLIDLLGGDQRYADKFLSVATSAIVKNSDLLDADALSILNAVRDAAQMGLEPAGPMQEGALVAYFDRDQGKKIAQFQPMFRGLRKLALQHPDVTVVNAGIRHEKDEFEYREGTDPFIRHVPWIDDDNPGAVMGAYAYAKIRGELVCLYMNTAEIRKRRKVARTQKVWDAWEEEMMLKTVTARLIRAKLPMTTKLGQAISVEEADLDRLPAAAPQRQIAAPGSRTRNRYVADDPETPENGSGDAKEGEADSEPEGAVEGASRRICGARGMKEGEVCVLDPHDEGPHEAENGAVWG